MGSLVNSIQTLTYRPNLSAVQGGSVRMPSMADFSWQGSVVNITTSTPPASPSIGDRYVVAAGATGAWAGRTNAIATYDNVWIFDTPAAGWFVWDNAGAKLYRWTGAAWTEFSAGGGGGGETYTDRGDPSAWDWTTGSFTKDANWYDLDCSSICPAGTTLIHFRVLVTANISGRFFALRENGNTQSYNAGTCMVDVTGVILAFDFPVKCDANRIVEYSASAATSWTRIDVLIRGWWS